MNFLILIAVKKKVNLYLWGSKFDFLLSAGFTSVKLWMNKKCPHLCEHLNAPV